MPDWLSASAVIALIANVVIVAAAWGGMRQRLNDLGNQMEKLDTALRNGVTARIGALECAHATTSQRIVAVENSVGSIFRIIDGRREN